MRRAAILYDSDCGFCKWTLAQVLRLDRERRLRPVALQSPEAEALLPGMGEEERMESWHLVTPDGEVSSAGAAFDPLTRILGRGRPFGALTRRFPRAAEVGYHWVANHRSFFGRLVRGRREAAERLIAERG
ncbi:MAG: thiol-disulfide oxidoreductase DCC family protein [Gaiellaceae bacterium]